MKKVLLGLLALCCSYAVWAQTVSASSVTFRYCETTYGSETKAIAFNEFPYTWNNIVIGEPGTYVTTITNARGCDSIVTLAIAGFHGFKIGINDYVCLAPGNLQYQPSTQTWRFAPTQYTYSGKVAENTSPSASQTGWRDMFAWGTAKEPLKWYQNQSDNKQYTWTDWGTNVIGSYPANYWRTLTRAQWNYITKSRPNAESLYLKNVTVCGVKGTILLPDDWNRTGWSWKTPYTEETWPEMEEKGAVFLPYCGYFEYDNMKGVGDDGSYWSSTPDYDSYAYTVTASWFSETQTYRSYCQAVRLAHDSDAK